MSALLEVRGLSKAFGGVRAVDDVSFTLRAGEFLAIVEREVGIPVNVVGVGAERDDYLLWTA